MRRDSPDAIRFTFLMILFRFAEDSFSGGRLTAMPAIGRLRESRTQAP